MNPTREVKTERFSRTEGKTPAFVEGEVQTLLGAVDASTHTGLRDRALLGVLVSISVKSSTKSFPSQIFSIKSWTTPAFFREIVDHLHSPL